MHKAGLEDSRCRAGEGFRRREDRQDTDRHILSIREDMRVAVVAGRDEADRGDERVEGKAREGV